MDLKKLGVQELNTVQMMEIEGGSWIGDALRWVNDHIIVKVTDSVVGAITSVGVALNF
ncbi:hypothetical protein [Riemerella anatipestifer]|uniref:hypothetical protein n=1 Tax=Riemerella anatipestifer TaxID=34085 RepID=UPI00129E499D|nr:hypothetical protein [Riemerella anatipestifer]